MSDGAIREKVWITVFTGNSGLTHYSFCLARALAAAGVDIALVTNNNYELAAFGGGFPVLRIFRRSRLYLVDVVRFWLRFRRERPDVLHYQAFLKFPLLEIILIKLQKRSGARLVYTAHDWLPHRRRRYHPLLFRLYYRQFDRIIVHSERGARFLEEELSVDPARLQVIPHGDYGFFDLDPGLTRDDARRRLGLDPDMVWCLFFGHIDAYKGLDVALGALGRLGRSSAGPSRTGLIVAGSPAGGDFSRYEELIRERGLADVVSLHLGHVEVEDVQLYFKAADMLLLPYRESSTSGLAHVAMGFTVPVIASAVGSLGLLVQEAGAGMVVAPGDEGQLADAIARLVEDEDLRRSLGAAWRSISERHSWEIIAAATLAAYAAAAD